MLRYILQSYAKINLFLHIEGKNSNNYHLLHSLMSYIDLYDDIEITINTKHHKIEGNYDVDFGDNLIAKIIFAFDI